MKINKKGKNNVFANAAKKLTALWLILAMIISTAMPLAVSATQTNTFNGNGFTAEFTITSSWTTGYNAVLTITNNTQQNIVNWEITANAYLGLGAWNANSAKVVSQSDNHTTISHQNWNNVLVAGRSMTFWLAGQHNGTPPNPTHFILTGDGFTSVQPQKPQNPDSVPVIEVFTPFPNGNVTTGFVDITYLAEASRWESVIEVSYYINSVFHDYLYLKGGNGIIPMGTLGQARVHLMPGENVLEFTVKDSAGLTASYTVNGRPNFYPGKSSPPVQLNDFAPSTVYPGEAFVDNRITILTQLSERDNLAAVSNAAATIGGTVIGYSLITGSYTIQVPANTEAGLENLGAGLIASFPNLIYSFGGVDYAVENYSTNDPWWNRTELVERRVTGVVQESWNVPYQWGLSAINLPAVWNTFGNDIRTNIRLGMAENDITSRTHEDLLENTENGTVRTIPEGNFINGTADNHATHVMGTMAAVHGNNAGLTGVINISRENIFGYGTGGNFQRVLDGFEWNIIRGVKAINYSAGRRLSRYTDAEINNFNTRMERLLDENIAGYDFIIVQAAGNDSVPVSNIGAFGNTTNATIRERILMVGASINPNLGMITVEDVSDGAGGVHQIERTHFMHYNVGQLVDVLAPGVAIYSSKATVDVPNPVVSAPPRIARPADEGTGNAVYGFYNGTSMAAPHVTALAAMVWSENPGLSGPQVANIIKDSARATGRRIVDNRPSIRNTREILRDANGNPLRDNNGQQQTISVYEMEYFEIDAQGAMLMARGMNPTFTTGVVVGQVISVVAPGTPEFNALTPLQQSLGGRVQHPARARLYRNNTFVAGILTNADGFFRLFDVAPGSGYKLVVSAPWHKPEIIENLTVHAGVQANLHKLEPLEHQGFDVVFALDDSGSISNADFTLLINETRNMIDNAFTVEDRISVFTFDSLVRRKGSSFMRYDEAVKVLPTTRVAGMTALNEAINVSNDEFTGAFSRANAKRIMIVITDGYDNQPGPTPADLITRANELDVTIFTIGIGSVNQGVLDTIATQTGGQFFHITNFQQLADILDRIRHGLVGTEETNSALSASFAGIELSLDMFEQDEFFIDVELLEYENLAS